MQAKHTPGPWVVSLSTDARVDDRITGANGATVVRGSIGYTPDAALIAAAPDLLAALREIVTHHGLRASLLRDGFGQQLDAAREVIARATGA